MITKDLFGNETTHYELAAAQWKRSDARDVTQWFEARTIGKSPTSSTAAHSGVSGKSRNSGQPGELEGCQPDRFGITKS